MGSRVSSPIAHHERIENKAVSGASGANEILWATATANSCKSLAVDK